MSKVFFDHLISLEDLLAELEAYSIPAEEKTELLELIDQIIHHHALNLIFNHLPKTHHQEFADLLIHQPHDPAILEFVQTRVTVNISEEIRLLGDRVKSDLKKDIKKARQS